jgi:ribosome biogenesis GTPase A
MKERVRDCDITVEIRDSRIPLSSANPEIDKLLEGRPRIILLSRSSLADPAATALWSEYFSKEGTPCLFCDFITGTGTDGIESEIRKILSDKIKRYEEKGETGRKIKAMVVGIPNVGKSTFINKMAKSVRAKAENRPGVTLVGQWVNAGKTLDLLDMPGVLWPKFDDRKTAENLALTGAIKDDVLNVEDIALTLIERLTADYPELLMQRYRITEEDIEPGKLNVYERIAENRGFMMRGGEYDYERTAKTLIKEFRDGKIGRISLERPES